MSGMNAAADAFQQDLTGDTRPLPPRGEDGKFQKSPSPEPLFSPRQLQDDKGVEDNDEPEMRRARARAEKGRPGEDEHHEGDDDTTSPGEEGEGDENEEAGEEEGEGEEERSSARGLDLNTRVQVNVDGKPQEVTLKEALGGYIRMQTFHQRLNEVNTERTTVRNERTEIAQARNVYIDRLQAVAREIQAFAAMEPDWDKEFERDPVSAAKAQRQWQKFYGARQAIEQEQQRVQAEQAQQNQRALGEFIDGERAKLRDLFPQWGNDPKTWERDKSSMARTAKAAGFTQEEIDQIFDHRYIRVLFKAAKYDRLMRNKPKPVADNKIPVRNGARTIRQAPKRMDQAQDRLARSGNLADAADVFKLHLDALE